MKAGERTDAVWLVWTEQGEYEDYTRDLRGVFAEREAAEEHRRQLDAAGEHVDEIEERTVLTTAPEPVDHHRLAAHILPDGTEDFGSRGERHSSYRSWSNETKPLDSSRIAPWNTPGGDLFVEVEGSDLDAVAGEYERLLQQARDQLATGSR